MGMVSANLPSEATIMDHAKAPRASSLKRSAARETSIVFLHTGAYRTGTVFHLPVGFPTALMQTLIPVRTYDPGRVSP